MRIISVSDIPKPIRDRGTFLILKGYLYSWVLSPTPDPRTAVRRKPFYTFQTWPPRSASKSGGAICRRFSENRSWTCRRLRWPVAECFPSPTPSCSLELADEETCIFVPCTGAARSWSPHIEAETLYREKKPGIVWRFRRLSSYCRRFPRQWSAGLPCNTPVIQSANRLFLADLGPGVSPLNPGTSPVMASGRRVSVEWFWRIW